MLRRVDEWQRRDRVDRKRGRLGRVCQAQSANAPALKSSGRRRIGRHGARSGENKVTAERERGGGGDAPRKTSPGGPAVTSSPCF